MEKLQKTMARLEIDNEAYEQTQRRSKEEIDTLENENLELNEKVVILKSEFEEYKNRSQEKNDVLRKQVQILQEELDRAKSANENNANHNTTISSDDDKLSYKDRSIKTQCQMSKEPTSPEKTSDDNINQQKLYTTPISPYNITNELARTTSMVDKTSLTRTLKPLISRKYSPPTNTSQRDKLLDEKLKIYLDKEMSYGMGERGKFRDKNYRRSKTEWFINIINSLDHKLNEIKLMSKV